MTWVIKNVLRVFRRIRGSIRTENDSNAGWVRRSTAVTHRTVAKQLLKDLGSACRRDQVGPLCLTHPTFGWCFRDARVFQKELLYPLDILIFAEMLPTSYAEGAVLKAEAASLVD